MSEVAKPRIWVDADACPRPIKEILFRAAVRVGVRVTLVANHPLRTPATPLVDAIQVASGFDVADEQIVASLAAGDLVITSDVPLAAAAVERGALALTPRGDLLDAENVRERLAMRDIMDELRGTGVMTGGPPPLAASDRQSFANRLDAYLARVARR
ncbi:MAG: YaiI/YqxD family protein [Ectothiorhodospiraceae bacterium]|nr:YaiI/YqxD family protein [Chromatiales bacterium]MCP5154457.1 YaiI/YqxD family protein [Ectothiorhodospiraceae bacterium]